MKRAKKIDYRNLFDISGKVVAVTGGGGDLGGEMARALATLGAKVAVLDLDEKKAQKVASKMSNCEIIAIPCNVLEPDSLEEAAATIKKQLGPVDVLINGAGGNHPKATTGGTTVAQGIDPTFFDLDTDGVKFVFDLNLLGTLLPSQVFGRSMVRRKKGTIVNISSMNAFTPLTKIPAYSGAKAAVSNFTQWLAVHFAPSGVRVNALAPGFFLTSQNRFLLIDKETKQPTPRGLTIQEHTPMERYGKPSELVGTLVWLISDASAFVTGTIIPIDGGFSAFSGV